MGNTTKKGTEMKKKKYVLVAVSPETRAALKKTAREERTAIYQLIQTMLEKFLSQKANIG